MQNTKKEEFIPKNERKNTFVNAYKYAIKSRIFISDGSMIELSLRRNRDYK